MADDARISISDQPVAESSTWHRTHGDVIQPTQGSDIGGNQPQLPATRGSVKGRTEMWQQKENEYGVTQTCNPFSGTWKGPSDVQLHKDDQAYGRPKEGSKTEYRGKQAGIHISSEVVELCDIIQQLGVKESNGTFAITFGNLFEFYTRISNKLVGMLMRARRQNLVTFEGEMLFQRRDDDKVIRLIQRPELLMVQLEQQKEQLQKHQQSATTKK